VHYTGCWWNETSRATAWLIGPHNNYTYIVNTVFPDTPSVTSEGCSKAILPSLCGYWVASNRSRPEQGFCLVTHWGKCHYWDTLQGVNIAVNYTSLSPNWTRQFKAVERCFKKLLINETFQVKLVQFIKVEINTNSAQKTLQVVWQHFTWPSPLHCSEEGGD